MDNFSVILDRIKLLLKIEQDKDLANYLEISANNLSAWKQRNSPNWEIIFEKLSQYDLNYIIYGKSVNKAEEVEKTEIENLKRKIEKQEIIIDLLTEKLQKEAKKNIYVKT